VTPDPSRTAVARELAPFALATLVAFALLPIGLAPDWAYYAAGFALITAALAGTVLTPWSALPASARLILPVAYLAGVALLRHSGGGTNTGVAILSLLPIFWVALHGTRLELGITVLGVGAFFVVPVLLIGGESYPASGLRSGARFMLVGGLIGETIRQLVAEVRTQAAVGQHEALTDALTATGNRRAWDQWLALATAGERDEPFAVGVLDLDHFKRFNDMHGHGAGDELLIACAQAWQAELRPGDQLARIGGEEFGVLLPATDLSGATAVVERLRAAMPADHTCSGGVAEWTGIESGHTLLHRADSALYAAKRGGRNRVEQAGEGRFSRGTGPRSTSIQPAAWPDIHA
jgi:diguanylate cyclase (GGDEF)-like protein